MTPQFFVDDRRLTQVLDSVGPNVKQKLAETLGPIGKEIAADANTRTAAHIHSWGAKNPGSLAISFKGGLANSKNANRVGGYARSSHPLAHLMERGFQIKDIMIIPGTGKNTTSYIGAIMAFEGDVGEVLRRLVHRHATTVPACPALGPAFEARRGEIMAALNEAMASAGSA